MRARSSPRKTSLAVSSRVEEVAWEKFFHTVDGPNPAPPKKPWNDSLTNANKQFGRERERDGFRCRPEMLPAQVPEGMAVAAAGAQLQAGHGFPAQCHYEFQ